MNDMVNEYHQHHDEHSALLLRNEREHSHLTKHMSVNDDDDSIVIVIIEQIITLKFSIMLIT